MEAKHNPLSTEELFAHVQDSPDFHVPVRFAPEHHGHIEIPQPLAGNISWKPSTGVEILDNMIEPLDLVFTKFMVVEVMAAVIVALLTISVAVWVRGGKPPKGKLWNSIEAVLIFIRDEIARPTIGRHDADKYLPFLWTMFFFVLMCNLLGMVPWLGSPTGALAVTGALALCTFIVVVASGMAKLGPMGFLKAQVPHMELPGPLAVLLVPMIFVIEVFGLIIKHFVLAVRLLANMMAGHVVLAVIVAFIFVSKDTWLWYGVTPVSVVAATALSLLELFVAFLQAYIFTFLSALFIGSAVHPH